METEKNVKLHYFDYEIIEIKESEIKRDEVSEILKKTYQYTANIEYCRLCEIGSITIKSYIKSEKMYALLGEYKILERFTNISHFNGILTEITYQHLSRHSQFVQDKYNVLIPVPCMSDIVDSFYSKCDPVFNAVCDDKIYSEKRKIVFLL